MELGRDLNYYLSDDLTTYLNQINEKKLVVKSDHMADRKIEKLKKKISDQFGRSSGEGTKFKRNSKGFFIRDPKDINYIEKIDGLLKKENLMFEFFNKIYIGYKKNKNENVSIIETKEMEEKIQEIAKNLAELEKIDKEFPTIELWDIIKGTNILLELYKKATSELIKQLKN